MSEEREVEGTVGIGLDVALSVDPVENKKLRDERKARFARILDRGQVNERLIVDLPGNLYGEWVPDDKMEIHRMQALGFKIDDQYATSRALHDKGDGRSVIGDVVFMICPREDKEILDEIRRENFEAMNGKPGQERGAQREEKDFAANAGQIGLPVIQESRNRVARKADLERTLQEMADRSKTVK